jgi:hypothetical protein
MWRLGTRKPAQLRSAVTAGNPINRAVARHAKSTELSKAFAMPRRFLPLDFGLAPSLRRQLADSRTRPAVLRHQKPGFRQGLIGGLHFEAVFGHQDGPIAFTGELLHRTFDYAI